MCIESHMILPSLTKVMSLSYRNSLGTEAIGFLKPWFQM